MRVKKFHSPDIEHKATMGYQKNLYKNFPFILLDRISFEDK